ncbi:MAG: AMIN domain-containing protein, partial [Porticoccaceae bacterium]
MITRLRYCITRFCMLGTLLLPSILWAADIESVRVWRAPDSTRLVLDLSNAVDHNLFALNNPNRLVIDLRDSQLKTQFDKLELANTPISGIRAAVRNKTDVRVVLDLKTTVSPKSFSLKANEQYSDRLVIDLFDKKRVVSRSVEEVVKKKNR